MILRDHQKCNVQHRYWTAPALCIGGASSGAQLHLLSDSNLSTMLLQDMFPDVELVRSMQQELDEIIKDGVESIVQLLRNSDSKPSSTRVSDGEDFEAKSRQKLVSKEKRSASRISDRLVNEGLMSDKMVRELHSQKEVKVKSKSRRKSRTRD